MKRALKYQLGFLGITAAGVAAAAGVASSAVGLASTLSGSGKGSGGGVTSSPGYVASQALLRKAAAQFNNLATPDLRNLQLRLQAAVFEGSMSPIQAVAMMQRASEMEGVEIDPRTEFAQYQSLERLARTVADEGMTAEDKQTLFATLQDQQVDVQGSRGRFEQSLAEQGLSNQDSRALERGIADQASANRGAKTAVQVAADALERKEAASVAAGNLAGTVRAQSFGEQSQKAQAQDRVNQANAIISNQFAQDNAENLRDVRDYTANTKQAISDKNTTIANQQAAGNVSAAQADYENRLAKARGQAAAYGTQANISGMPNMKREKPSIWPSVLGTVAQLATGYANAKPA